MKEKVHRKPEIYVKLFIAIYMHVAAVNI